jgi:hypothetical protein
MIVFCASAKLGAKGGAARVAPQSDRWVGEMAETVPARLEPSKAQASEDAGYRKGDETRRRILDAALTAFGGARQPTDTAVSL